MKDFFFFHTSAFQLLDTPWSQVSSFLPAGSCLQFLSRIRRVQQSHCSSTFHRMLLTRVLALSAGQFVRRKSSHERIRACTRGDSNSRNWPIPGSRITWYVTGATGWYRSATPYIWYVHVCKYHTRDLVPGTWYRYIITESWSQSYIRQKYSKNESGSQPT